VKDVEEAFHAQMCEAAEEQCGKGDAEACEILVLAQGWRTKSKSEVRKKVDIPVIPKIPEVVPQK
jgi:hypothetical protein